MKNKEKLLLVLALAIVAGGLTLWSQAPREDEVEGFDTALPQGKQTAQSAFSFFVTSVNPGKGADLGGLLGADAYCQTLAENVGAGGKTWHAYLSASESGTQGAVDARDRIGAGPWYNVAGMLIASDVDDLHSSENRLTKETALNEKGEVVAGRGDMVNMHDILTGSTPDGRLEIAETDTTCDNWTSSGAGSAVVGHHDRIGRDDTEAAKSWNSSHATRGCSMEDLKGTGGAGPFYCFAE